MDNLENAIFRDIGAFFGIPYFKIFRSTRIEDDLGAGDVDFKELIWIIEEKYNVVIEHHDLETVGNILSAIERSRITLRNSEESK